MKNRNTIHHIQKLKLRKENNELSSKKSTMRFVPLLMFDWRVFCACKKWVAWFFSLLICLFFHRVCAEAYRRGAIQSTYEYIDRVERSNARKPSHRSLQAGKLHEWHSTMIATHHRHHHHPTSNVHIYALWYADVILKCVHPKHYNYNSELAVSVSNWTSSFWKLNLFQWKL